MNTACYQPEEGEIYDLKEDDYLLLENWFQNPEITESNPSADDVDTIDQYIRNAFGNDIDNNDNRMPTVGSNNSTSTSRDILSTNSSEDLQYLTLPDHCREMEHNYSQWNKKDIQHVIDSPTNPVGKFLRDSYITAEIAENTNIMPYLIQVP